jgi:excisionase family DNA binding protein
LVLILLICKFTTKGLSGHHDKRLVCVAPFPDNSHQSCSAPGRDMEKFCIVKRRRQGFQGEEFDFPESMFIPLEDIQIKKQSVLSFGLTPEQSQAIRSGGILPLLEEETPRDLILTMHQYENGAVIFNFHLDLDRNLEMFKPNQVCQMMQISRTLLNRMIHNDKIKSYKVGRLRRFRLKDIIEALNQRQL